MRLILLILLLPLFAYPYGDVLRMSQGGTGSSAFATGGMCFSDGTKLTTDAANIFWDNSGKLLGIGINAPTTQYNSYTTSTTVEPFKVEINGVNTGQRHINLVTYYNGNGNVGPYFMGTQYGGSKASPLALVANDLLFAVAGEGYNGSALTGRRARISMFTEEIWNTTNNGSRITFETTPNGSTSIAERMRIDNAGQVGIGITPTSTLHVSGTSRIQSVAAGSTSLILGNNRSTDGAFFRGDSRTTATDGDTLIALAGYNGLGTGSPVQSGLLQFVHEGTGSDNKSSMRGYTHDGSSLVERLRVTSEGKLGVGGTPTAGAFGQTILAQNTSNANIEAKTTDTGSVAKIALTNSATTHSIGIETSTDSGGGAFQGNASSLNIETGGTNSIYLTTNGVNRMLIDSGGKVATTSPVAPNYNSGGCTLTSSTRPFWVTDSNDRVEIYESATNTMAIDSQRDCSAITANLVLNAAGGNVGVNLTPAAKFHIGTGTGFGSGFRVSGSNDNAEFYMAADNAAAIDVRIDGGSSGGTLQLNPSGGAVTISDAGNAGGNVPHACTIRTASFTSPTSAGVSACSAGEIVTGGGCSNGSSVSISASYPTAGPQQWNCAHTAGVNFTVYAICCKY